MGSNPVGRRAFNLCMAAAAMLLLLHFAAYANASQYAYIADNATNSILVVNVPTNTVIQTISLTVNGPYSTTVAASGNDLYISHYPIATGAATGAIAIMNLSNDVVVGSITANVFNPLSLSINPANTIGYLIDGYHSYLIAVTMATKATTTYSGAAIGNSIWMRGAALTPNGNYLYITNLESSGDASGENGNVMIWSTATDTLVSTIVNGNIFNPYDIAIAPNGQYAYIANYGNGNVLILSLVTNTIVGAINSGKLNDPQAVAFSPGGTIAYVANGGASSGGNVLIISTATNTIVGAVSGASFKKGDDAAGLGIAFGPAQFSIAAPTPTSQFISAGQTATVLDTGASDGAPPDTYQWFATTAGGASFTAAEANILLGIGSTNGQAQTQNAVFISTVSTTAGNYMFELQAADTTSNTAMSTAVTVAVSNVLELVSPSAQSVDQGQQGVITGTTSGGNPPYTWQWYATVANGATFTAAEANALLGSSAADGNALSQNAIFVTSGGTATGTYQFELQATDNTGNTFTSTGANVAVSTQLGTPSISPSSATYDSGQQIVLTASDSGGTSPYTYQWFNCTVSCASMTGNTASTTNALAGASAQTVKYAVQVTDGATVSNTMQSATDSYVIDVALLANTPTVSNTVITRGQGQSSTLTANPGGGTGAYSGYQWYTVAGCTAASVITGATSSAYTATPLVPTTYYYHVSDSSTNPPTVCSSTGVTVMVLLPFVVGYTSVNSIFSTNAASLALAGVFTANFIAIAGEGRGGTNPVTNTIANVIIDASNSVQGNTGTNSLNASVIGRSTAPTISDTYTGGTSWNTIILGVSANVIYTSSGANGAFYSTNGIRVLSATRTLSYTVASPDSYVLLLYAAGGNSIISFAANAMPIPGCSTLAALVLNHRASAAAIACSTVPSGTYTANIVTGTAVSEYSMAAYVFPPYTVTLSDTNGGGGGTITANGTALQPNGNTISVIGTNGITANPPGGYSFNNWISSGANIIVANTAANPTTLTVEGSGTLTANYVTTSTYTPPTITISNPANTVLDMGQPFTLNGVITGSATPFTVNIIVSNVLTPTNIVANDLFTTSASTWTATFVTNSLFVTNSPVWANAIITDSNTPTATTANSVYTATSTSTRNWSRLRRRRLRRHWSTLVRRRHSRLSRRRPEPRRTTTSGTPVPRPRAAATLPPWARTPSVTPRPRSRRPRSTA